jgi:hypothetical protein
MTRSRLTRQMPPAVVTKDPYRWIVSTPAAHLSLSRIPSRALCRHTSGRPRPSALHGDHRRPVVAGSFTDRLLATKWLGRSKPDYHFHNDQNRQGFISWSELCGDKPPSGLIRIPVVVVLCEFASFNYLDTSRVRSLKIQAQIQGVSGSL